MRASMAAHLRAMVAAHLRAIMAFPPPAVPRLPGENGVAAARGKHAKVRGGIGSVLVVCVEKKDSYEIAEWKAAVVDGERIRPDTWYTVENGEFKEAD